LLVLTNAKTTKEEKKKKKTHKELSLTLMPDLLL
jgi:hypothetical protein